MVGRRVGLDLGAHVGLDPLHDELRSVVDVEDEEDDACQGAAASESRLVPLVGLVAVVPQIGGRGGDHVKGLELALEIETAWHRIGLSLVMKFQASGLRNSR